MKRLGTRDAIRYAIDHLTVEVRTSGAVNFREETHPTIEGRYILQVYSYNMCIAAIHWGFQHTSPKAPTTEVKRAAIVAYLNTDKRSVTTSKHQSWTFGAVISLLRCPRILTDMADDARDAVAAEYALENGLREVDAIKFMERGS